MYPIKFPSGKVFCYHVAASHSHAGIYERHNIGLGVSRVRDIPVLSLVCSDHNKRMSHAWERKEEGSIFKGCANFREEGFNWLTV